jgi:hypothetical protein
LAVANGLDLLAFERSLGLDIEAGLQALILPHHWVVTVFNWIYIWGHWPVIAATLVWLYRTRRADYLLLRNALFISGAIGLVIFAVHPVAPPRLLPSGFVDTVTELSTSYRVLQPPSLVNKFAALPSLHVGWNLLIGVVVYRTGANRRARVFGVVSPMAMAAAVVLTGNHYVVDAALGAVVALTGLAGAWWLTSLPGSTGGHVTGNTRAVDDRWPATVSVSAPVSVPANGRWATAAVDRRRRPPLVLNRRP